MLAAARDGSNGGIALFPMSLIAEAPRVALTKEEAVTVANLKRQLAQQQAAAGSQTGREAETSAAAEAASTQQAAEQARATRTVDRRVADPARRQAAATEAAERKTRAAEVRAARLTRVAPEVAQMQAAPAREATVARANSATEVRRLEREAARSPAAPALKPRHARLGESNPPEATRQVLANAPKSGRTESPKVGHAKTFAPDRADARPSATRAFLKPPPAPALPATQVRPAALTVSEAAQPKPTPVKRTDAKPAPAKPTAAKPAHRKATPGPPASAPVKTAVAVLGDAARSAANGAVLMGGLGLGCLALLESPRPGSGGRAAASPPQASAPPPPAVPSELSVVQDRYGVRRQAAAVDREAELALDASRIRLDSGIDDPFAELAVLEAEEAKAKRVLVAAKRVLEEAQSMLREGEADRLCRTGLPGVRDAP
eukprot:scaffold3917_cov113-Isochrysis_galbana.AAC.3